VVGALGEIFTDLFFGFCHLLLLHLDLLLWLLGNCYRILCSRSCNDAYVYVLMHRCIEKMTYDDHDAWHDM
jgi:hypothetical protein